MRYGRVPYGGAHRAERDFIPEGTTYIKREPAAATRYNSPSLAKENSLPRPTMM
jgi:hypothetical protein